jgi:hypothetical protein
MIKSVTEYLDATAVKFPDKIAFSDGPPGVKTIWTGLQKLYTLLDYRELFDFMGQV